MAERKSVNKYYPPDWDPSKGSVNQYVGQHPLRDRAKKLGQGILVISHIGMGVRYNAEKTKTGMYYTTPLYKFRMKCHLCDNYFEIQTDPKKERDEDVKLASLIKYRALDTYDEKQAKKRKEIEKRPIFHSASKVPKIATPEHKSVNILKDNIKSPFGKNASVLSRTKSSLTKASLGICKKEFKTPGLGLLSMKAESQSKGKKIENPTNFETSKYTNGQEINIVEERLKETDEDIEGEVSGNITDDVSTAAIGDDCGQSSKDNVTVPILLDPLKSKPVQAVSGLSLVGSYSDSDSDS
ncbi:CC130-like protein [Mya arenaria]|uniref:CC130-like protein n=1 Tax=Mya arenaria TaxID=6604 RepID=A0ABY7FRC1_MYAAR|nr:CC130-like protein [Mya arenaria]